MQRVCSLPSVQSIQETNDKEGDYTRLWKLITWSEDKQIYIKACSEPLYETRPSIREQQIYNKT
jgi:hypothetical protein